MRVRCCMPLAHGVGIFPRVALRAAARGLSATSTLGQQKAEENASLPRRLVLKDFLLGSQQAYYAAGIVMGALCEGVVGSSGLKDYSATQVSEIEKEFVELLQKKFPDDFPQKEDPAPAPADMNMIEAFQKVLPVTKCGMNQIFSAFLETKAFERSMLELYGPTDYIIQSQLMHYGYLDDTDSFRGRLAPASGLSATTEELRNSHSDQFIDVDDEKSDMYCHTVISLDDYKSMDAKAFAIVRHTVVEPPLRHSLFFEYFYAKMWLANNENQRVLAAKRCGDSRLVYFVHRLLSALIGYNRLDLRGQKIWMDEKVLPAATKESILLLSSAGHWKLHYVMRKEDVEYKSNVFSDAFILGDRREFSFDTSNFETDKQSS
eukprot:gene4277-3094_t